MGECNLCLPVALSPTTYTTTKHTNLQHRSSHIAITTTKDRSDHTYCETTGTHQIAARCSENTVYSGSVVAVVGVVKV